MKQLFLPVAFLTAVALAPFDLATPAQAQAAKGNRADPFGGFGSSNSKDPIRVDANKLEVFDKEQKAVYSGDVVAVRGTATTRSTVMTIFYESKKGQDKKEGAAAPAATAGSSQPQDGALRRIEFKGPVTVVNGSQTMKADDMVYDAVNKVLTLKGNAVVTDGPNIQRGELMTYNTESGIATIVNTRPGGRVQGVFTPGSQDNAKPKN